MDKRAGGVIPPALFFYGELGPNLPEATEKEKAGAFTTSCNVQSSSLSNIKYFIERMPLNILCHSSIPRNFLVMQYT